MLKPLNPGFRLLLYGDALRAGLKLLKTEIKKGFTATPVRNGTLTK